MRGWHSAVLAALLLGAVWQLVVWTTGVQHFILPSPGQVLAAMWKHRVLIGEHAWVTLVEVLLGLAIGSALGIATAIHLSVSATAQALLRPLLVFSQAIPVFALAPILTLWLGYGLWSKIAMAVLIIYFPVTSAFFDGLMRTPHGFMDLARTMGARPAAIMFRIRIPAALPALGTGLKLAAVYAPIGAVIGEWVGASRGLGYLMLLANGRAKIDLMFAAMLVLGVVSVGLYLTADFLTRRAFFTDGSEEAFRSRAPG
ncbi:MAG: ABC transporter permease [Thiotrichales bacterium]|nr:ABC transporter permease [Thiotrichales bacterium]